MVGTATATERFFFHYCDCVLVFSCWYCGSFVSCCMYAFAYSFETSSILAQDVPCDEWHFYIYLLCAIYLIHVCFFSRHCRHHRRNFLVVKLFPSFFFVRSSLPLRFSVTLSAYFGNNLLPFIFLLFALPVCVCMCEFLFLEKCKQIEKSRGYVWAHYFTLDSFHHQMLVLVVRAVGSQ